MRALRDARFHALPIDPRAGSRNSGWMALPPGPAYPGALQTLFFLLGRERSLERNTRRWGNLYTRRDAVWGAHDMVSDPDLIKQILTAEPGMYHAGEINAP